MAVAVLSSVATAADEPQPFEEVELPVAPLVVSVDSADISVVIGDDAEPVLRWRKTHPSEPGVADLAPASVGGTVTVERPPLGDGATAARLTLELVVSPVAGGLTVVGDDIELVVGSPAPATPTDADQIAKETQMAARPVELRLTRSRAQLTGIGGLVGKVDDCLIGASGTSGSADLTVNGGDLRVEDHRGTLKLVSQEAAVVAERVRGPINIQQTGGSVMLSGVEASFNVTGTDAQVELVNSQGNGTVGGSNTSISVRDSKLNRLNLRGTSNYINLSRASGTTTIDLAGGSLTADDATGQLNGGARDGADVAVTIFSGDISLNLSGGARGDLRDVDGNVSATVNQGELDVDGATSLAINADAGWVTAREIRQLTKFQARSSQVELDLSSASETEIALRVERDSSLRVELATPCRVRVTGVDATLASQVEVLGCELQFGQGRRWATRRVRGVDGNLPTTLTVTMADSGELVVEGR